MTAGATKREFEDIECIVCTEQLLPPVYQCCRGHLICAACLDKVEAAENKCPSCRGPLPKPRTECLVFRQIAKRLQYSCPHPGCKVKLQCEDARSHKASCPHRPVQCGYCDGTPAASELLKHMLLEHKDTVTVLNGNQVKKVTHQGADCFEISGLIGCGEAHAFSANGQLVLLDIGSSESKTDEPRTWFAFAVVLTPDDNKLPVHCRVTIEQDGSTLMCKGPAYSYDTWLEGYDNMISMGCPFPVAPGGNMSWAGCAEKGDSVSRFSYKMHMVTAAAAAPTPTPAPEK